MRGEIIVGLASFAAVEACLPVDLIQVEAFLLLLLLELSYELSGVFHAGSAVCLAARSLPDLNRQAYSGP